MVKCVTVVFFGLIVLSTFGGCGSSPATLTERPPANVPPVLWGTPEDAAQTVLLTLQTQLRAAAHHDAETGKKALAQMHYLVAKEDLMRGLKRMPQYKALLGEDLIEGLVDNWAATISYYAEGFRFDQMQRDFESSAMINGTPTEVHVVVPAQGANDEARIQVNCLYEESGDRWLVARVGFAGREQEAVGAASHPASK